MPARILDGRALAATMQAKMKADVEDLLRKTQRRPFLLSVQVGMQAASDLFMRSQQKAAAALGIGYRMERLPIEITQGALLSKIVEWNKNPEITGITVQFPLPPQLDPKRISAALDPRKDVEGIHPQHIGQTMFGWSRIGTCTSLAVITLIESTGIDPYGKEAVVVGHSELIGKPVSLMLLDRMCTTTICHLATDQRGRLQEHVKRAEILVVAAGKPELIRGSWIRRDAVVIDVGINLVNGRVVGDVEYGPAAEQASYITPVPGGVGPVVVATLMRNTVEAVKLQLEKCGVQHA
ncbi:MAG: bifunctional 5,10-methylenetetrahydrofolate dehydrogenase/5,10-methenyltetrahydrofolate cyclohydrolase [Candidatus Omnitrophica bacterium]|nr:bifunctional 5,10-methylenetetrahydrofolate dehydrogenase/5,10-methenyltetrahydrofolate cyclohydrolase [Candidatus Omnitrophota bacterium]